MTQSGQYLIVPINVEAFCINEKMENREFFPPLTHLQDLPYDGDGKPHTRPFLSESVVAKPGETEALNPHDYGVHLHWAMPDALMHGEQDTNGVTPRSAGEPLDAPVRFPHLPDRWLVTRTGLSGSDAGKVQQWVVDSRVLSSTLGDGNRASAAIPWDIPADPESGEKPFRFLGRALPLSQWTPPEASSLLPELNATSLGFLQAPAYYPSCRNVFGMHDPTASEAEEYSYAVCGWHSVPAHDPLRSLSAEQTQAALEKMRWIAPAEDASSTFAGVLYTGVVHSLRPGAASAPAREAPLTAVIGNTAAEANATLHKSRAGNTSDRFHTELQALLSGQLDRLSEPGGSLKVARQFHQQRFFPASHGRLWYVMRKKDGADAFADLTPDQQSTLTQLNAAETLHTERRATAESLQWQLYADWCKYLRCRHPERDAQERDAQEKLPDPDDVRDFIKAQSLKQSKAANELCKLAALDAARLSDSLKKTLDAAWDLARKPQPDTWRPVDPVLLLQGEDVRPALRFGGDGELGCQVFGGAMEHAMLYRVELREGEVAGVPPARVETQDAPALELATELGAPKAALQAAFVQALLLWPSWTAAQLTRRTGKPDSATAVEAWLSGPHNVSPWSGKTPSPKSITPWSGNPWLPIVMHWEIVYEPLTTVESANAAKGVFPPGAVVSNISERLDADDVDLEFKSEHRSFLQDHLLKGNLLGDSLNAAITSYEGITFITPQAGQRVRQQLEAYRPMHPRSALAAIAPRVNDIPVLSQTLSGFHDRLLLRRQTLQIDIRDPFASSIEKERFIDEVRAAITDLGSQVTTMAPIVQDRFSPVRGGDFMLRQLQLGDVFGQRRVYNAFQLKGTSDARNTLIVAPALARESGKQMLPCFPPRISQPARLDFHWLRTDNDDPLSLEDAAASPICGWVVPNYLEQSLAFYGGGGDSVGSIMVIDGTLAWIGSPAHPETFGKSPVEAFAKHNVHLRDFVLSTMSRGVPALKSFLHGLGQAVDVIQPLSGTQHAGIPNLIGQPLALTRASIELRYAGATAVNQTWGAFRQDIEQRKLLTDQLNGVIQRTTNRHERVQYPVVLGLAEDPDDGLVGFYKGGKGEERYESLYLVAENQAPHAGITPSHVHSLTLSVEEPECIVTMLVDPRSAVAVTTGYTPAQARALPPEAVKNAFARMAITFLAAPVLTTEPPPSSMFGSTSLPVPLPGQQKGHWNWLSVKDDGQGPKAVYSQLRESAPADEWTSGRVFLQEGWLSLSGFGEAERKQDD